MTGEDRRRWDERYADKGSPRADATRPPRILSAHADTFPITGRALDIACGQGLGSVWLALRGMEVWGLDISAVAIDQARDLAQRNGVADRCRFDVVDLDDGLPAGPAVDVVLCHKFRDRRLDEAMLGRLRPGGLLALVALSEVGAAPGPFRATPGELPAAFPGLELVDAGEGDGSAWLLGRADSRLQSGPHRR